MDLEDLENDEELLGGVKTGRDKLDSYVEELSILKGKKRAPPAV